MVLFGITVESKNVKDGGGLEECDIGATQVAGGE